MNILLLGDSHTDIFLRTGPVTRFELSQCNSTVFTIHKFTDPTELDLWSKLEPWLASKAGTSSSLIISGGEIDIRAHFWRHIPRAYTNADNIITYVSGIASKFYNALVLAREKYQLENIVIWSAPVAGERADYNYDVPFVGSSQTRNILVHLLNKSLLECIKNDSRVTLATAYYNFIDPNTYFTTQPNPSHDGVHWYESFGPMCWEQLICPALSGNSMVGDNFNIMKNDKFDIVETVSNGTQKYDTWARTDQLKNNDIDTRTVIIKDTSYSWIKADQRSLLPEQYKELAIQKI